MYIRYSKSRATSVPPAARQTLGIHDNFVRLSVGVEDPEDLIEDLDRALATL